MKINHLDHLVLTVASISITSEFYSNILGMQISDLGDGRTALLFGNQKINLHQKGKEVEPKANLPTPGSADLCFIADDPVEEILRLLREKEVEILQGPVERTGAKGKIISVYFRDPDLNLVEVSNYL